jgi:dihydroxyacetone kinase
VEVQRRYLGEYATSLEMAGASLTVMRLDERLVDLLDHPARSPFFRQ